MRRNIALGLALVTIGVGVAFAAIDSQNKRRSIIMTRGVSISLPTPDGTISTADRYHLARRYRGFITESSSSTGLTSGATTSISPFFKRRRHR